MTLQYALQDHTHQSPTIYWTQGLGPTSTIVSNRSGYITITSSPVGGTNFAAYEVGSGSTGLVGSFGTIGGGYENNAAGSSDTIAGGSFNNTNQPDDAYNTISGGTNNNISQFTNSVIAGGNSNTITNSQPGYVGFGAFAAGYFNTVILPGGVAMGAFAYSYMYGQQSFASGSVFGIPGSNQYSKVVLTGTIPPGLPGFIDLIQGLEPGNAVIAQPDSAITAEVTVIAAEVGGTEVHSWILGVTYICDAFGNITVLNTSTIYEFATAATVAFTTTVVSGGTFLSIIVNRNGGGGGAATYNCTGTLKITEVITSLLRGLGGSARTVVTLKFKVRSKHLLQFNWTQYPCEFKVDRNDSKPPPRL